MDCERNKLTIRTTLRIAALISMGKASKTSVHQTVENTPATVSHCTSFVQSFIAPRRVVLSK